MTNYEFYKDELEEISKSRRTIAIEKLTNKPLSCNDTSCKSCLRSSDCCSEYVLLEWGMSEHQDIDWNTIPVDAKVIVFDEDGIGRKRYFAKYQGESVYCWNDGKTSWSALSDTYMIPWDKDKVVLVDKGE